ncbi:MAG: FAD-dependent oxidoreductase [Robiginitomaculum sp.]|nr:FAD-dependent oxidoreductase [Robiginitomaculum sp.]
MKPENPDFQIIGGGLIGLSTAYALLKHGASVRVIEARESVALETSFANAGMVHASLCDPWNGPGVGRQMLGSLLGRPSPMTLDLRTLPSTLKWGMEFLKHSTQARHWSATKANYALAHYSMAKISNWRVELNIEDDYTGKGLLKIFRNLQTFETSAALTSKLQALGLQAETLGGKQAAQIEPALAPIAGELIGAIYYPNDYKADAYNFCTALARAILKQGGEIITDMPANTLIREAGKTIGVSTKAGDFLAGTTIIASGARSAALLRLLGIRLPMHPVKGYSLTFPDIEFPDKVGPKLPVVDDGLHCAVTPLHGALRIAGTAEITGFDTSMTTKRLAPLLEMLRDVYPELAEGLTLKDGQAWHGFRPVSADGMPFIGTVQPGLALNTGHGHMGWTMSAGSGVLLADILLGQKPQTDPIPFKMRRL